MYFYPRSPCGERQPPIQAHGEETVFLSTLSLRRATSHYDNYNLHCTISIHALLAESDVWMGGLSFNDGNFYPRSPCGERRKVRNPSRPGKINFYPRSPCGERLDSSRAANCQQHFYPRSPCGERRTDHIKRNKKVKFLSTLSLRRATARRESRQQPAGISIHALLAESDPV